LVTLVAVTLQPVKVAAANEVTARVAADAMSADFMFLSEVRGGTQCMNFIDEGRTGGTNQYLSWDGTAPSIGNRLGVRDLCA
jgi:hypothetical protein